MSNQEINDRNKSRYLSCIEKAIDFIESNLDRQVSTEAVASIANFSPFYFHRLFCALTGESISDYARGRRLSEAARALTQSRVSILQISLNYGFESQEAFTRAFKRAFGIPPGKYRANPHLSCISLKKRISAQLLLHLGKGVTMQPKFVEIPAQKAVGLGGVFAPGDSAAIGALWDKFIPRLKEVVQANSPVAYGICMPNHPEIPVDSADRFVYVAALPVAEYGVKPDDFINCEISAGRYAVFTHKGPIEKICHTINYIWGTWLPTATVERREAPDFELYDHRFQPASEDSEFDIYIPIK